MKKHWQFIIKRDEDDDEETDPDPDESIGGGGIRKPGGNG